MVDLPMTEEERQRVLEVKEYLHAELNRRFLGQQMGPSTVEEIRQTLRTLLKQMETEGVLPHELRDARFDVKQDPLFRDQVIVQWDGPLPLPLKVEKKPLPKRKVRVVRIRQSGEIVEVLAEYEAEFVDTDLALQGEDQPLNLVMAPESVVLVVMEIVE